MPILHKFLQGVEKERVFFNYFIRPMRKRQKNSAEKKRACTVHEEEYQLANKHRK